MQDRAAIETILATISIDDLARLSIAVGEYCPEWKYAQDVCLRLAEHPDGSVRANACLGLGYIARTHGRLEKYLVTPKLLRELRCQAKLRGKIVDAIAKCCLEQVEDIQQSSQNSNYEVATIENAAARLLHDISDAIGERVWKILIWMELQYLIVLCRSPDCQSIKVWGLQDTRLTEFCSIDFGTPYQDLQLSGVKGLNRLQLDTLMQLGALK